jgi:hypothetical protein
LDDVLDFLFEVFFVEETLFVLLDLGLSQSFALELENHLGKVFGNDSFSDSDFFSENDRSVKLFFDNSSIVFTSEVNEGETFVLIELGDW